LILAGIIYGLLKLPKYSLETVDLIDDYGFAFTILGALGSTFFGNQLGFIRRKINEFTMRLIGYPKGLIKKETNAN
jgi:thiamine transporter ThiT